MCAKMGVLIFIFMLKCVKYFSFGFSEFVKANSKSGRESGLRVQILENNTFFSLQK